WDGANCCRNWAGVRNRRYCDEPGVATAVASRAAASPPRQPRYTRNPTRSVPAAAPCAAAGRAQAGERPASRAPAGAGAPAVPDPPIAPSRVATAAPATTTLVDTRI